MKPVLLLFLSFYSFTVQAQLVYLQSFEFEDTVTTSVVHIDTVNYPGNIWQIGTPQKTVFNAAYVGSRAIVTDTVNTYPINDTSVFYMKIASWQPITPGNSWYGPLIEVEFRYQLDKDSGDFAILELSRDSGQTWVNYLDDSLLEPMWSVLPDFDTSTNGWVFAQLNQYYLFNVPEDLTDSLYLRFTFISDSNDSQKDGWMLDHFHFQYFFSSVNDIQNNNLISIYPNPSTGRIKIQSTTNTPKASIQIFNLNGQKVYETNTIPSSGNLDLPLPDGIYILKYSDEKETAVKRLLIQD